MRREDRRTCLIKQFLKMPVPQVTVKQQRALVGRIRKPGFEFGINVTGGDRNILPSIVVEVLKSGTPADKSIVDCQAGRARSVFKDGFAHISIEHGKIPGEVCLENIQVAIAVIVADGYPHACLFLAILAIGDAPHSTLFSKSAVVVVHEEKTRTRVARDVDVGPSIIVKIGCNYSKAIVASCCRDPCCLAHIAERAIAVIAIETVLSEGKSPWSAIDGCV